MTDPRDVDMQYTLRRTPIPRGERLEIFADETPVTFRSLFDRLARDPLFAEWYATSLAASPLDAFFWEHPPLTAATFDTPAEWVMLEAPMLARMEPDPEAFRDQFDAHPNARVIDFRNLGGDAQLVVPLPIGGHEVYGHLAAFVRGAPAEQVRELFAHVAETLLRSLRDVPIFLSTAGMGVSWLHVRLDATPKYYRHGPYRRA